MNKVLLMVVSTFISLVMSNVLASAQEKLQMGVSVDIVQVASDFAGRDIVIFGSIENADQAELYRGSYQVVIEAIGALEEVVVRKKDRIGGIWINAEARNYVEVPSFYSVLSQTPLSKISDPSILNSLRIGIDNISARPASSDSVQQFLTQGEFSSALRRIRIDQELFGEDPDALQQLSPSLFRATLKLPPNVPIGTHTVRAHLFHKGKKLDVVAGSFEVRKVGFERWIYDLAHEQSLLYGIMCVLLAIFTGWAANAIFRKN